MRAVSGPQARPASRDPFDSGPDELPWERSGPPPRRREPDGPPARRKHPVSVRLSMFAATLLVIVAAGSLGYFVVHNVVKTRSAMQSARHSMPTASPASPGPSPSLGLRIASRTADPAPVTVDQLFPASFADGKATVTRMAGDLGPKCAAATDGTGLQVAVAASACTQVARATYLDTAGDMMATIGVLNLGTAAQASTVSKAADPKDFIAQLPAASGPAHSIGKGTGVELAAIKGHYLILIWAEFTSLKPPANTAQAQQIDAFMTQLFDKTANVSLTQRMLTGKP